MPHQIVEYSENLEARLDVDGLIGALHQCAAAQDELPLAGLRTRAHPVSRYRIADGNEANGFIAVYLRLGAGRSQAVRERVGKTLFDCLCDYAADVYASSPLALSLEVQEIDPQTRWNQNNLREYVEE